MTWVYWIVSATLAISLLAPRRIFHWIGFFGCCIMSWRVYSFSKDWPQLLLNMSCVVFHLIMLVKLRWFPGSYDDRAIGRRRY